jgi:sigma-B regulation protein RsbU (phosphoserine phosphatase)
MQLSPGNVLLLYTDGLKDAANEEMKTFEKQRIKDSLQQIVDNGHAKASDYVHHLVGDVAAFVKDAPQSDDLTLMAIVIKK